MNYKFLLTIFFLHLALLALSFFFFRVFCFLPVSFSFSFTFLLSSFSLHSPHAYTQTQTLIHPHINSTRSISSFSRFYSSILSHSTNFNITLSLTISIIFFLLLI
ncbi:hypothetical protein BDA99DRAFT_528068 [Phascolomyces articulosus]|uniref:Uncharacterized protein n=1 Tax=Phascolomyces articulosus TaxID=60185 RepID=A0AAD5P7X3_9FUNG|nr:hypothetical protein BDA99DRAFT_528068 [Phascolomyces articulosus]